MTTTTPPSIPLSPRQIAAIEAPANQPTLILAGAGTGKTTVLTHRVAHLIRSGLPPETVCLLTFTNKAARHMLDRAAEMIGPGAKRPSGGTFHHFGCRVLREEAQRLGLPGRFRIMDASRARALFKAARQGGGTVHASDEDYGDLLRKWNLARATCSPLHGLLHHSAQKDDDSPLYSFEEAIPIIRAYEKEKTARGLVDYDDLLLKPVQLLEQHRDRRQAWQRRCRHLLIDEYQDTNPLQAYLVRLLTPKGHLTAVGDEAQCIYSWCGTPPGTLRDFTDHYPSASIHSITANHRSTPEILRLANAFLQSKGYSHHRSLESTRASGPRPIAFTAADADAEAEQIVQHIRELHRTHGYGYDTIAALHRTQAEALPLAEALDRAEIPFRMGPMGEAERENGSPPIKAVTLSTIHKAKGLEYPVVFLPGLQHNGFPHSKATTGAQLDEEHRLFYVALTRAKQRLYLSACQKGQASPGGYFDALPDDLIDTAAQQHST